LLQRKGTIILKIAKRFSDDFSRDGMFLEELFHDLYRIIGATRITDTKGIYESHD
jgi:hypothetical protein